MKDFVDLKKVSVELFDAEIICTYYKDGFTIDETDAREIDDAQQLLSGGNEVGMLIDLYDVKNKISREAKDYFTKKGKMLAFTKAVAVVQKSGQDNLPGGFLESFKKPIYPVKNFETRKEAIEWLKSVES